jgi:hypothetical protein
MRAKIKAAIAATQQAIELSKAAHIDQEAMLAALEEAKSLLSDVQTAAFDASETSNAAADRIRALEAEARDRDDWKTRAAEYEFRPIAGNVQAWVKRGTTGYLGTAEKLCPRCFVKGEAMPLQHARGATSSGASRESIKCSGCTFDIAFNGGFETV